MAPMGLTRQPDEVALWDSYTAFNVTSRFSHGMNCYGTNRSGGRCAWDIPPDKFDALRTILDYIETQPPQDAVKYLRDIASLSLCQKFHQNQAFDFVDEWRAMLKKISYSVAPVPPPETKPQASNREAEKLASEAKIIEEQLKAEFKNYKAEIENFKSLFVALQQEHEKALEVERKRFTTMQNAASQKLSTEVTSLENKLGDQLHTARQKIKKLEASEAESLTIIQNLEGKNLVHARSIYTLEDAAVLSTNEKKIKDKKIADQENELKFKNATIDTLLTAKGVLSKEVETLKSELEESKDKIEKLKAATKEAEWSEKSLSDQAQNLQFSLDEEKKVSAGLRVAEADLLARLDALRAEMAIRAAEADSREDNLETLTKTISELIVERDTLQTRLDSAEKDLDAYREEDNGAMNQIDELKALNAGLAKDKATLQIDLGMKERELDTRQQKIETLIKDGNMWESSNSEIEGKRRTLETSLRAAESRFTTQREETDALAREVEQLKTANSRLAGEKDALRTRLGSEEGELSSLIQQLQLSNEQIEAARRRPFRFMTKCWAEKVRRNGKKNALERRRTGDESVVVV